MVSCAHLYFVNMETNFNSLNQVNYLIQLARKTERECKFLSRNLKYIELFQQLCSGGLSFLHNEFGSQDVICIKFDKYADGEASYEKIRKIKGVLKAAKKRLSFNVSNSTNSVLSSVKNEFEQNGTKMTEVFVTYSWGNQAHEDKVLSFTNHLRKSGFKAVMDKMLIQENAALDFVEMMHVAMTQYEKVIIVLSESYKEKAHDFLGGVGNEYSMILKSIRKNPKKYILVSFEEISDSIVPLGLEGREIVNMSNPENESVLVRKLLNKQAYKFSDVTPVNYDLDVKPILEFTYNKHSVSLEVVKLISKMTNSMSMQNIYSFIVNEFYIEIVNTSSKSVSDFVIEVKLPGFMVPRDYLRLDEIGFKSTGEDLIKSISVESKLYPGQPYVSEKFMVEVNSENANRAKEANIHIKLFSEMGNRESIFPLSEYFKVSSNYDQSNNLTSTAFG